MKNARSPGAIPSSNGGFRPTGKYHLHGGMHIIDTGRPGTPIRRPRAKSGSGPSLELRDDRGAGGAKPAFAH
jgi:hypothetical protein